MKAGFLVIDKPAGVTSHDVVAAVRAVTGIDKVGHTGTLDPFATGVLPLALGAATRLIQFLDESVKVYDATIAFGTRTDTGDPTGTPIGEAPPPTATREEVEEVLATFLGERMQTPPAYSAVKKDGRPLYSYARQGTPVDVAARPIRIHDLSVVSWEGAALRVRIECTRGTYARVLADEIATALGTVGHLSALVRPRSGPFWLQDALDLPTLAAIVAAEAGHSWQEVLLARKRGEARVPWRHRDEVRAALEPWMMRPLDALSHLPLAEVAADAARRFSHGGAPPPPPPSCAVGDRYLVVEGDVLLAVAERTPTGAATLRMMPVP
jgi:tRNA pseudouridine55 synthase